MGGATMVIKAKTKAKCDRLEDDKIQEAYLLGLEDVRERTQPVLLSDGLWYSYVKVHS